uniref:Uncharacterized protein n=1 Tax=Anguilla anguilla TaxID=7936 RepID=A0A0E9RI71_ANGAN
MHTTVSIQATAQLKRSVLSSALSKYKIALCFTMFLYIQFSLSFI